jgi:glutathione S-transferase
VSKYVLYGRTNTGSAAVEALLAEAGASYELKDVAKNPDGSAPDWFKALNPRGEVPVLQLPDGGVMTESAAIMIFIADQFPGFAPKGSNVARATYLRWMVFLSANAYNSDLRMYYPERYSSDLAHAGAIKQQAERDLARDLAQFAGGVGEGPYVLGKTFSAVDIYASMLFTWAPDVNAVFRSHPNLHRLYSATVSRPKIRSVWERHGSPMPPSL